MVNQETITDNSGVFDSSGTPTAALLRKLTIHGGTEKVANALKKHFKWDT